MWNRVSKKEIALTMYTYLNNEFVLSEQATLNVRDLAIQRGYGVFDFFRVKNNVLLYVEDHLNRFFRSADMMRMPVPYSRNELMDILTELNRKNNMENSGIRIMLTGGYSTNGYTLAEPNFICMQMPLTSSDFAVPTAVSIITHEYVREIPEAKTINYTMGIWLHEKLKTVKAYDVLYHINGVVSEFPRCNFFIVNHNNEVVTPEKNVLKGITRKNVLEIAKDKYEVFEKPITIEDIVKAKEAFLTSSAQRIQPIGSINGKLIGNGEPGIITNTLAQALKDYEEHYISKHS